MNEKPGGETLLDSFLPNYEFRGIRSITIKASPSKIFRVLREVTLEDMPTARFLGELRYLPVRIAGKTKTERKSPRPFLDIVLQSGNIILGEEEGREMVVGAIAKFHQISDQQFAALKDARTFLAFDDPGYQKLAQSFRVSGCDEISGCRLTLEHRTHALSRLARKKFSFYWIFIKPGSAFLVGLLLRAIRRRAEKSGEYS